MMDLKNINNYRLWAVIVVALVILLFLVYPLVSPLYSVYSQKFAGTAMLAKAESEKRVLVETAKAKRDAARLEAEAEIERAKGVAEANRIIAGGLENSENYLKYLWISKISSSNAPQIIYVPTETGLPILESGRTVTPVNPNTGAKND